MDLTPRQRQVLALVARGKTNREIADALGISLDGAKFHVSEILERLDVANREEAAQWWRQRTSIGARLARAFAAPFVRWTAVGSVGAATVAAIVLVLVIARPGGKSGEEVVATVSPAASATSTSEPAGRRVVLWEQSEPQQAGGDVVVYDLDAGRELKRLPSAGASSLGNDGIVLMSMDGVEWVDYEGSKRHTLYRTGDGLPAGHVVISPDGKTAAYALSESPFQGGRVIFTDFDSGSVIREVTLESPAWPELAGSPEVLRWRSDGRGVVVAGGTGSERPGGIATVYLDGTIAMSPVQAFGAVSPNAELFAYNDGASLGDACMFIASTTITVVDLATGTVVAAVTDPTHALTRSQWSPDGSTFLYQSRPYTEGPDCPWTAADPQWSVLPVDGGAPTPVNDVNTLFEDWYGSEYVTFVCAGVEEPAWMTTDGYWTGSCRDGATATITIGGNTIGSAWQFLVIGFADATG